jgi:ABC-2 type transport system permease protein
MSSLWGSVSAELLLLRKRVGVWVLLGIWTLLAITFSYVFPYITYVTGSEFGPDEQSTLAEMLPAQLIDTTIAGFPFFGGALTLILGVLVIGSDYGWGTLKTLYTQGPSRIRVFTAKLLALGIALVPFVLGPFAVNAAGTALIASQENGAMDWPSVLECAQTFGAGWLVLAVWTLLGVLLATLTRGTALAIGIGVLYTLVLEGLISAFATQIEALEPLAKGVLRTNTYSLVRPLGTILEGSTDNGPGSFAGPYVGTAQALLVLAAYVTGFILIAATVLRRRDVV